MRSPVRSLIRPVFRQLAAGANDSFTGVLDGLSTSPALARSVSRALLTSYVGGSLVDLRRSSDNGTRTIVAGDDGEAVYTGYDAWAGADTIFCSKVYDQSGNGKHWVQGTAGSQPKFTKTGGLNSIAAIFDDNTRGATMTMTQGSPVNDMWATGGSAFVAMSTTDGGASLTQKGEIRLMQAFGSATGKVRPGLTYGWSGAGFGSALWMTTNDSIVNQGDAFVWGVEYSAASASNDPTCYVNGSAAAMTEHRAPSGTAQTDTDNMTLFAWASDGSYFAEDIYFAATLSSGDRGALQTDMVGRYVP